MRKLSEIAESFADFYIQKNIKTFGKEDLVNAFAYGAKWGKSYLWNKVGSDAPSSKSPYRQIAVVLMISKEEFDIEVIVAEDFEEYINKDKLRGVPVLWCYLRDLLFKQVKDKAVYGYKKKVIDDDETVDVCEDLIIPVEDLGIKSADDQK